MGQILVPRVFSFSNMAAGREKTLGHSRSRDQNLQRGWRLIQNGGQGEAVRGSGNKIDQGRIGCEGNVYQTNNDTKAQMPALDGR